MNKAMEYMIFCADKGDLAEFIEKNAKSKRCIYRGDNGLDLHFRNGKIEKVTHAGVPLKIVEL